MQIVLKDTTKDFYHTDSSGFNMWWFKNPSEVSLKA